ncbi:unnamed protein product [Owenia fusiformis]|uniref:Tetraspanin n=1 Tax=Owenia fusiformis TaxID=6347 RepID=A0A8J1TZL2_OWEFU|nr:unnamed protein product [Owenia fusiformis]
MRKFIGGILLLAFALYLRLDPLYGSFINGSRVSNMCWVSHYWILSYLLMGSGFIMAVTGLLGVYGAHKEKTTFLGIFCIALLIVVLTQLVVGILGFIWKEEFKRQITDCIKEGIRFDYGQSDTHTFSIDYMQRRMQCCGGDGPVDYANSNWGRQWSNNGRVPSSCCSSWDQDTVVCNLARPTFVSGCSERLIWMFERHGVLIICVSIILVGFEALGFLFNVILWCALNSKITVPEQWEMVGTIENQETDTQYSQYSRSSSKPSFNNRF